MNLTTLMLPTRVMPAQWFIYNVRTISLSIKDKYISAIEPNAFNNPAFIGTLAVLKLYMPLEALKNGTFSGLTLGYLKLRNMKLQIIETVDLRMTGKSTALYVEHSEINMANLRKLIDCFPADIGTIQITEHKLLNIIPKDLFSFGAHSIHLLTL